MACSMSDEAEPWQQAPLAATNLHMLEKEIFCDVTFLAGKIEEPVRAHKFMLASRSAVFYAMLCGPLAESKEAIIIPDIEADILKAVIQYMYTAVCELTGETVMTLLYAAKKYEVQGLVKNCSEFLNNNMEDENVCTILQQAIIFCVEDLVKQSLSYIFVNAQNVLKSRGFLSLNREEVQRIIESDDLEVDELSIYRACLDWARHQFTTAGEATNDTNLRKTLGDLVYNIRFPNMTLEDFTLHVSLTGILTDSEKIKLFQSHFVKIESCDKFISRKRRINIDVVLARFNEFTSQWVHENKANVISFTCSRTVRLKGVYIFLPISHGNVCGKLDISDDDNTLRTIDFDLNYEHKKRFKEVLLDSPLTLAKEKVYHLQQVCNGRTYYGVNGNREVVINDIKVTFFRSSKNQLEPNDANNGQFYGLHVFKSNGLC